MTDTGRTCPSSLCRPGSQLLGIVGPDGTVAPVQPPLSIDATFVQRAHAASPRPPESRFRFAGPCETDGCQQWTGERCSIAAAVARCAERSPAPDRLPRCAIRPSCQWFAQEGTAACKICPDLVRVTHMRTG
jgi:hypothetical protein